MAGIFVLNPHDRLTFPDVELALHDPNGLLAVGGDLSTTRLLQAYKLGIFPWYNEDQPILWWCPDPRAVLLPEWLKISRSLRKTLKRTPFRVSFDQAFSQVLKGCAAPRRDGLGTWISPDMERAYNRLFKQGHAHSVECWQNGTLMGGLYGVAIGRVFFGESMFSRTTDASKVALVYLVRQLQAWGFRMIDCQVSSAHLASLGAADLPRHEFTAMLDRFCNMPGHDEPWIFQLEEPVQ